MAMNRHKGSFVLATAICAAVASSPAHSRGGSASGARGSASWQAGSGGSATTARGSTASWGGGSGSAQGARGGSAAWSHGSGTATGAYGNTAAWNHNTAYGHPPTAHYAAPYPAAVRYPAPVYAAPAYYGKTYNATTGEVAAAGMAGLAVGAMAGSAAAKNQQSASTTQAAAPPPSAQQPMAITSPLPIGSQLSGLPAGCTNAVVKSVEYYGCGPNWFKPVFGSSGVYYQVVHAPF